MADSTFDRLAQKIAMGGGSSDNRRRKTNRWKPPQERSAMPTMRKETSVPRRSPLPNNAARDATRIGERQAPAPTGPNARRKTRRWTL